MRLTIDWSHPIIAAEDVLKIQTADCDDFYVSAHEADKTNLFFVLLASLHHYEHICPEKAAHLSFLLAYYLFVALTPPGSAELASHYLRLALTLNPRPDYAAWLPIIAQGN